MTSATATPNGCDYVVHLAAIAGVDSVMQMLVTTNEVNILEKCNLLQAVITPSANSRPSTSRTTTFGSA